MRLYLSSSTFSKKKKNERGKEGRPQFAPKDGGPRSDQVFLLWTLDLMPIKGQQVGAVLAAHPLIRNTDLRPFDLHLATPLRLSIYKASDLSSAIKGVTLGPCKPSNGEGSVACLKSAERDPRVVGPKQRQLLREL